MNEQNEPRAGEAENGRHGERIIPSSTPGASKPISRRVFVSRLRNLALLASLTHFTLLAGEARAADDPCPGGVSPYDVCNPPDNQDKCPGEKPPADECPADGNRTEDICYTGGADADTCNEASNAASDQCESGTPSDDLCQDNKTNDACPSGISPDDACAPDGTTAQGDFCPGGDPDEGLDTCAENGDGDDCTPGKVGTKDDCKASHPDVCDLFSDDFCPNGTDANHGAGGDDWCDPSPLPPPIGSTGSDVCVDGSDAQDVCNGASTLPEDGLYDTCPGGGNDVDHCPYGTGSATSDDYCLAGSSNTDVCFPPSPDECPGGVPAEDVCDRIDPDECPGGGSDVDKCDDTSPDVPGGG